MLTIYNKQLLYIISSALLCLYQKYRQPIWLTIQKILLFIVLLTGSIQPVIALITTSLIKTVLQFYASHPILLPYLLLK